jgi:hypothetical protein
MGLDSADSHHTANAICLDPGGAIYLSDGVFHRTQIETAAGPVRNNDAAIFRFEPRTGRFETYIAYGFANPHGRVFDRWGNDLVTDATGNNTYFGAAFSGWLDYPAKHAGMKQFWERPSRPCPGTGLLSSRHFPEEFQGNFLNINVIGFQGIFRVKVSEDGSGLKGETLEHLVQSSDPNFRPSAISVGPDGALYFVDWHKPLIGHMQHHIRDPNRDKEHGRIYRITYEGRPLLQPKKIHGQPIPDLLRLLEEPEDGVRELAKVELGARDDRRRPRRPRPVDRLPSTPATPTTSTTSWKPSGSTSGTTWSTPTSSNACSARPIPAPAPPPPASSATGATASPPPSPSSANSPRTKPPRPPRSRPRRQLLPHRRSR